SAHLGTVEIAELLLLSFPLSFLIYGINDVYDIETDSINPRKGGMWGHILEKKDIAWVMGLSLFIAFLLLAVAYSTLNALHAAIMTVGVAWPIAYSMPPLRLKTIPVIDSIVNAGYGYFPFALACSLSGSLLFLDYRIIAFSLCLSTVHATGTIMDMETDRKFGIKTFATVLGPRAVALFAILILGFNLTFLPWISMSITACAAFATLLFIYLFIYPTPANAKTTFKLMIACFFVWLAYFVINHIVLGNESVSLASFETGK
ncbi:UbiA family prenyltransferase, partial [Candidatus Micrarchaeota archaeon]|nr:UbiA family prenyltransferase [Candidatus Micrarchaeota archaeon]